MTVSFVWIYRKEVFGGFSWYINLWSVYEIIILWYEIIRLLQTAFFFMNASILAALVQGGHCKTITKELRKVITAARTDQRFTRLHPEEAVKVASFLSEHNAVSRLVMEGNRTLWGTVMAVFLLTNVPLNCYVLSQIVLSGTKTMIEVLSLYAILLIQLSAFAVTMWPLSYTCKQIHASQSTIVSIQPHLNSRWIVIKCKLDALKERLNCGPKVAVTIGPARSVTMETLSEASKK